MANDFDEICTKYNSLLGNNSSTFFFEERFGRNLAAAKAFILQISNN